MKTWVIAIFIVCMIFVASAEDTKKAGNKNATTAKFLLKKGGIEKLPAV
jgi:hypothetical protein